MIFAPALPSAGNFPPGVDTSCNLLRTTSTAGNSLPSSSNSSTGKSALVFSAPGSSSFHLQSSDFQEDVESEDEVVDANKRATLQLDALEFIISLSEAKSGMVRKATGWVEAVVRACLEVEWMKMIWMSSEGRCECFFELLRFGIRLLGL
ncbi:hypothetical protein BDQ12DRAFT_687533 [Crucibulum laeve]|uniref:Uncharacterized protein n=1 Tax=Crucibulum laeve TaxID=68775 RepID=A0A5C3LVU7_9AGAR|nr:hypothetical protein BDQ12DRAFT_687533 [Crucibulum laeve]